MPPDNPDTEAQIAAARQAQDDRARQQSDARDADADQALSDRDRIRAVTRPWVRHLASLRAPDAAGATFVPRAWPRTSSNIVLDVEGWALATESSSTLVLSRDGDLHHMWTKQDLQHRDFLPPWAKRRGYDRFHPRHVSAKVWPHPAGTYLDTEYRMWHVFVPDDGTEPLLVLPGHKVLPLSEALAYLVANLGT